MNGRRLSDMIAVMAALVLVGGFVAIASLAYGETIWSGDDVGLIAYATPETEIEVPPTVAWWETPRAVYVITPSDLPTSTPRPTATVFVPTTMVPNCIDGEATPGSRCTRYAATMTPIIPTLTPLCLKPPATVEIGITCIWPRD